MQTLDVVGQFFWGAVGGGASYLVSVFLPILVPIAIGDDNWERLNKSRIWAYIGMFAAYILLGGIAAIMWEANTVKFAITVGVAFQSVVKGVGVEVKRIYEPLRRSSSPTPRSEDDRYS